MSTHKNLSVLAIILAFGAGVVFFAGTGKSSSNNTIPVSVKVPELSFQAATGKKAFDANCAACHGVNAAGTQAGPPLIHTIYNPGHHSDAAFYRAVKYGVPSHHWKFGNMPPLPSVSDAQVRFIVRYIRELQTANGITYKKHMM